MSKDPICEADVDEREAQTKGLLTQHDGKTFFFCCQDCKDTFEKFPDTYARLGAPPMESAEEGEGGFPSAGE